MPLQVVNTASIMCSFGAAPGTLLVPPANRTFVGGQPAANIMDNKPMANIPPFGVCMSLANPQVAAATAAALGVLTPMPCIPVIAAPWAPGAPKTLIGNLPALGNDSKCMCNWAGVIQVVVPGQFQTMVG
jgi:hypothetical protein